MNETLDPTIKSLAQSIKRQETGGHKDPYNASGASGEFGAYQFMPNTYKAWAGKYLGDPNAPATVENQNKIAYSRIKEWKDQGLNPAQIAAAWNAGEGSLKNDQWKTNVGVNSLGVKYDTPSYVRNVSKYYNEYKNSNVQNQQPEAPVTPVQPEASPLVQSIDKYGKMFGNAVIDTAKSAINSPTAIGGGVLNAIYGEKPTYQNPLGEEVKPANTIESQVGNIANTLLLGASLPEQVGKDLAINATRPLLAKIAKASIGGAGLFGAQGVASAMGDNQGPLDVAMSGLKNAGLGALTMGALGAGSGVIQKLSGVTKKFDDAIMKAKNSGDQNALDALWQSPEGQSRLKSFGWNSPQEAEQAMNKTIDMQKNAIVTGDTLVKNPTKQAVINDFLNKNDSQVMKDFSQYVIPDAADNVPNMLKTTERIKSEMGNVANTKNALLSEASKAGVNFDIHSTDLINKAVSNLETAGINEGLAKKYILDEINKVADKNGVVSTANQSKLQTVANKNFNELGSYEDSSREAASRALGNALRGHIDDTINKASGLDTSLANGIKNLNLAYGRLANVNRVVSIIPKSFRVSKNWAAGQLLGAIASHGYDPITYQVTKAITDKMMGKKASVDVIASLTNKAADVAPNEIKESVANAKGLVDFLKNKTQANEAARTAKVAKDMLAKREFEKAGNIQYTPDSELPVINVGPTPKSKYAKVIKDLPTIQLGKNPKGSAQTNALAGIAGLSALTGGNKAYNALQQRYGTETYNSQSTQQTINGGQNIDNQNGIVDGIDITKWATNPNHEKNIKKIHSMMPDMSTSSQIDEYIHKRAPNSPIKGDMIIRAHKETGVPPKVLLSIFQEDSMFGTKGLGAKTKNPGNWNNNDSGHKEYFKHWYTGVLQAAKQLKRFEVK